MSDEDRDIDIESDDDDDGSTTGLELSGSGNSDVTQFMTQAEKRAHHNALERKRRDHIKDSFQSLRDAVPALHGEKVSVSRAQILKKASDYIQFMRRKNHAHNADIDDLRKQNNALETQIRALEKAKSAGTFAAQSSPHMTLNSGNSSENETGTSNNTSRRKRLKTVK